jgi:hypothetical protein
VSHSILVILCHLLTDGTSHAALGGGFFDRLEPQLLARYCVKRLHALGYNVTLESPVAARPEFSGHGFPIYGSLSPTSVH